MQKMKSLLPSLKEKKRYLAFEIISIDKVPSNALNLVTKKLNNILGIIDSSNAGLIPVEQKENKAIIRINNKYVDKIKSAMLFINEINNKPVILKSIKVSGILNKARKCVVNNG